MTGMLYWLFTVKKVLFIHVVFVLSQTFKIKKEQNSEIFQISKVLFDLIWLIFTCWVDLTSTWSKELTILHTPPRLQLIIPILSYVHTSSEVFVCLLLSFRFWLWIPLLWTRLPFWPLVIELSLFVRLCFLPSPHLFSLPVGTIKCILFELHPASQSHETQP